MLRMESVESVDYLVSTYHAYLRVSVGIKILVIPVIRGDKKKLRMGTVSSVKSVDYYISTDHAYLRVSVGQKIPRDPRDPWSRKTPRRGISNESPVISTIKAHLGGAP